MTSKVATIRITINVTDTMLEGLTKVMHGEPVGVYLFKAYMTELVRKRERALEVYAKSYAKRMGT